MTATRALRRIGILAAAALLVLAVTLKPLHAMGPTIRAHRPDPMGKKKPKHKKTAATPNEADRRATRRKSDAQFLRGYRAARELILAGQYQAGIAAMHALGHDDHPDVANYIGYANRKMGNYEQSKVWYEAALKADPNHTRTWSYYGMWQMEQGNRLKAQDDLQKVKLLCGSTTCKEYIELKAVIDGKASY